MGSGGELLTVRKIGRRFVSWRCGYDIGDGKVQSRLVEVNPNDMCHYASRQRRDLNHKLLIMESVGTLERDWLWRLGSTPRCDEYGQEATQKQAGSAETKSI